MDLVIGPTVSWFVEMGITPAREVNPTVGLILTILLYEEGLVMLPLVSVPSATAVRPIDDAIAEPVDDPEASPPG